jgi:hypothetical protein
MTGDNGNPPEGDYRQLAADVLKRARLPAPERNRARMMLHHYDADGVLLESRPVTEPPGVEFLEGIHTHNLYWQGVLVCVSGMSIDDL